MALPHRFYTALGSCVIGIFNRQLVELTKFFQHAIGIKIGSTKRNVTRHRLKLNSQDTETVSTHIHIAIETLVQNQVTLKAIYKSRKHSNIENAVLQGSSVNHKRFSFQILL
jgi:hypothetical protein